MAQVYRKGGISREKPGSARKPGFFARLFGGKPKPATELPATAQGSAGEQGSAGDTGMLNLFAATKPDPQAARPAQPTISPAQPIPTATKPAPVKLLQSSPSSTPEEISVLLGQQFSNMHSLMTAHEGEWCIHRADWLQATKPRNVPVLSKLVQTYVEQIVLPLVTDRSNLVAGLQLFAAQDHSEKSYSMQGFFRSAFGFYAVALANSVKVLERNQITIDLSLGGVPLVPDTSEFKALYNFGYGLAAGITLNLKGIPKAQVGISAEKSGTILHEGGQWAELKVSTIQAQAGTVPENPRETSSSLTTMFNSLIISTVNERIASGQRNKNTAYKAIERSVAALLSSSGIDLSTVQGRAALSSSIQELLDSLDVWVKDNLSAMPGAENKTTLLGDTIGLIISALANSLFQSIPETLNKYRKPETKSLKFRVPRQIVLGEGFHLIISCLGYGQPAKTELVLEGGSQTFWKPEQVIDQMRQGVCTIGPQKAYLNGRQ